MSKGLDSPKSLSAVAHQLVGLGYSWVARYLFNHSAFKDCLTHPEALALSLAGLNIVTVWESGFPTVASYFTAAQGHQDACLAYTKALAAAQPSGTVIYFAVDGDVDPLAVVTYFETVSALLKNLGGRYTAGVYGSGAVCAHLKSLNLVTHTWESQSHGWSGYNAEVGRADLVQGPEQTVLGIDVDVDESPHGTGGGWRITA